MFLFCDGFDSYAASADLVKKWANNSDNTKIVWSSNGGRFGGGCIQMSTTTGITLETPTLTSAANLSLKWNVAFWFKASAKPAGSASIMNFRHGNSGLDNGLQITANGNLQVIGFANIVLPVVVCDGNWHWIEYLYTSNPTAQKVVVDGSIVYNAANSSNGYTSIVGFQFCAVGGITISIDDVIIIDDQVGLQTGDLRSTVNTPIGAQKIETIRATSAGSHTNWAPDSGVNYTRINEVNPDGDTSYVAASGSGTRDSYLYGSIIGINPLFTCVNCYSKNSDAGSINIQGLTYSNTTYGLGDSKPATYQYNTLQFPIFRDPNTSAAWTKAGVNAAEFGVGVV